MTASGIGFARRMHNLAARTRPSRRALPTAAERARFRARRRRGRHYGPVRHLIETVVWTLVVLALWSLWNFGIWGWV
jgi:hypothetical protein